MATASPLIIRLLKIRKMPGFPEGLDGYGDLAPGMNIIAGPNASGKSSTARVIQQLIFRNKTDGLIVRASVTIGNEPWEIIIDSNYVAVQRNGIDADLGGLPPSEAQSRYMLALHELITENEDDLARQIIKESIGGYDLDEAASDLGYSPMIRNKSVREFQDYENAERDFKRIRKEQHDLKDDELRLESLSVERKAAEKAMQLKSLYETLINSLEAQQVLDSKLALLSAFPAILEKMAGHEYSELESLEEKIGQTIRETNTAKETVAALAKRLSQPGIPESGIDDVILEELDKRIERLSEIERKARENLEKSEASFVKENEALKNLGIPAEEKAWQGADLKDISGLDEFLKTSQQIWSEKQMWESRIQELRLEIEAKEIPSSELLNMGIRTLTNWLQENHHSSRSPAWLLPTLLFLIIASGLLAYYLGWIWLTGPVLAGLAIWLSKRTGKMLNLEVRMKDYRKTGLEEPAAWNVDRVAEKLEELIGKLGQAKAVERNLLKIDEYEKQLEKLDVKIENIDRIRNEWKSKLKAAPEDYSGLYVYIMHIREWQTHHSETEVLTKRGKALEEEYSLEIGRINTLLKTSGVGKVSDSIKAKTVFKKLEKDEFTRRELIRDQERLSREILYKEEEVKRDTAKLRTIYNTLEVEEGNKEIIRHYLDRLEDYRRARKEAELASGLRDAAKKTLENHPMFNMHLRDAGDISIDTAKERLKQFESEAEGLDELKKVMNSIETLVGKEKKGHMLEDAITLRDDALTQLGRLYDENMSSLTGHLIVNHLKKVSTEQNRPAVFRRASELLNRITKGRYELRLEEKGDPSFRAFDTKTRTGHSLNQLSTGTRIQLLIAVRLAFIETQEPALKLPILADELLANSDDIRASAIIEALTEIAREGRQIFYFTAQDDEVMRWKNVLSSENDSDYRIIRLSGKSDGIGFAGKIPVLPAFIRQIPEPVNDDHNAYANQLDVPAFNLMTQDSSGLHLWYLINDNRLLYNVLKSGLTHYGQLSSYLGYGGQINGLTDEIWHRMNECTAVLDRYIDLCRTGRPGIIDRQVLLDSGAVSDTFINDVTTVLHSFSGNPEKLVEALYNGSVSGFRHSKTDQLEAYLSEHGFIDPQPILPDEEIWLRLHAYSSGHGYDPSLAEEVIKRIISLNS